MWLSLLWMACSGGGESGVEDSVDDGPCAGDARVEIGDGTDPFVPIAEGASVTMVHGPQGGWHMLAGVRVTNTDDIVSIHYTIHTVPDGVPVSDNNYRVQLRDEGNCQGTYWNMYGYLDASALVSGELDTPPELLCGAQLKMTIEVEDGDAKGATADLLVTAAADPLDHCGPPEG
jgi:hypothetical protein